MPTSGSIFNWITSQADILNNVANNLPSVQRLISGFAYIMGIGFAFKAMYSLKTYGEMRTAGSQASIKEALTYLIVASVLIYMPTAVQIVLMSSFGSPNILAYSPVSSSNAGINVLFGGSAIGLPLTIIIQTIGLWSFVKGWVMIARTASGGGQQQGGISKGLVHVMGGVFALNIVETVNIINNTLYGT